MKKRLLTIFGITASLLVICAVFIVIGYFKFMTVDAVEYDPQLEILLGGGGNSIILTSEDGSQALVVDTKMGRAAKLMGRKVKAKEVVVVNTHFHPDHIRGNALFPRARLIAGAYTKEEWAKTGKNNRYPDETIAVGAEKILTIGTETVHVRNMGRAHTTNDCVVYLEKRKLLVTGDLVFLGRHPALMGSGCNVGAWIGALGILSNTYDIKTLVPGHGPVSDRSALAAMADYFVSIRDAIGDPQKLAALAKKYKKYAEMPGMSGFGKTVKFIENEKRKGEENR
jgi:glyoxylase-like metal-dependent hydrolase (beta-lactamase superfamily II)